MQDQNFCCGTEGPKACHCIKHIVMAILAIVLIIYVGALTRNAVKDYGYIGKSPEFKNQVSFSGTGKVVATPDVAVLSIGILTEKPTVVVAQKENTDKMNKIIDSLKKEFKIAEADIQTSNYSISPKYQWEGVQKIIGYEVSQNVTVKVRNFDTVGAIIAKSGELGSNNVSGPNFTIDDPEQFKVAAREKAIAQAKEKAKVLAGQVGVKLGSIINFFEDSSAPTPYYGYADGIGGMGAGMEVKALPTVQVGSEEVIVNVTITYEIR